MGESRARRRRRREVPVGRRLLRRPQAGASRRTLPGRSGTAPPNGYGLIDIGFNIHEWCSDWYDPAYYAVSPDRDPQGPPTGKRRSSRGGAWRHLVKISRCSARSSIPPDYRYNDYGFRVVQQVDPAAA